VCRSCSCLKILFHALLRGLFCDGTDLHSMCVVSDSDCSLFKSLLLTDVCAHVFAKQYSVPECEPGCTNGSGWRPEMRLHAAWKQWRNTCFPPPCMASSEPVAIPASWCIEATGARTAGNGSGPLYGSFSGRDRFLLRQTVSVNLIETAALTTVLYHIST